MTLRRYLFVWGALLLIAVASVTLAATCQTVPPAVYPGEISDRSGAFNLYGDSRRKLALEVWRDSADRERRMVIDRLAAEKPDFVVHTGDLVANGSSRSDWILFDEEHAPIRESGIPFFPGRGNHEYSGEVDVGLDLYFSRFPFLLGRKWYDVRYRGVLLLLLDTNVKHLKKYEREAQIRWLESQLDQAEQDPQVRCVFLVFHHPPYTNATSHSGSEWVEEKIVGPARKRSKVKAVFAGHVHSYERFFKHSIHFVVSGGGGAPLVSVGGKDGVHADLYDGPRRFHYCRITVGITIRVDVLMMDEEGNWSRVDGFEIAP